MPGTDLALSDALGIGDGDNVTAIAVATPLSSYAFAIHLALRIRCLVPTLLLRDVRYCRRLCCSRTVGCAPT
eukprot:3629656-Rhodomonas_salina.1